MTNTLTLHIEVYEGWITELELIDKALEEIILDTSTAARELETKQQKRTWFGASQDVATQAAYWRTMSGRCTNARAFLNIVRSKLVTSRELNKLVDEVPNVIRFGKK